MKETKQKEYIQSLIEESVSREEQIIRIQELYNICKEHFTERDFTELSLLAVRFALPWVRRHLWNAGCYSHDNEDTVMQEVRIAIWKTIVDAGNAGHEIDRFAYYILSICKNKTFDVIRLEMRERKRRDLNPIGEENRDGESIPMGKLPSNYDDYGEKDEKRQIYESVFRIYCFSMMNSTAFPPRCLALHYARVLPHLLSEIPDTKAASAKWAFERMDHLSVRMLTQDSEQTLKECVDEKLEWGPRYVEQLGNEILVNEKRLCLGDVIYTSIYDKDKIEDWSDSMHRTVMKKAVKILVEDQTLLGLVTEYASTERVLRRFLKNKEEKRR